MILKNNIWYIKQFWKNFHSPVFYLKESVSQTGFCSRFLMEPSHLDPIGIVNLLHKVRYSCLYFHVNFITIHNTSISTLTVTVDKARLTPGLPVHLLHEQREDQFRMEPMNYEYM
jgi:hypothetical protein